MNLGYGPMGLGDRHCQFFGDPVLTGVIPATHPVGPLSPVAQVLQESQRYQLVRLSRHLYRFNSLYKVLIDTVVQLVVSDGLKPQYDDVSQIKLRKKLEQVLLYGSGGESPIELQTILFREFLLTGEVGAILTEGGGVLVLPSERIKSINYDETTGAIISLELKNKTDEILTIEENFVLLLDKKDINDLRGSPPYSSIFSTIHRINDVLDAEALNCSISSRILAARYRPDGPEIFSSEPDAESNPLEINELDYAVIFELDSKEKIEYLKRDFPNNFQEIINLYIRFISACAGLPLEYLMKDLQNLNFSSSRMMFRLLHGRISFLQNIFFDKMIKKLYYFLTGREPTGYIVSPTTIVDDLREVQAITEKMNSGLISKTTAASELGYNYEEEKFLMEHESKPSQAE